MITKLSTLALIASLALAAPVAAQPMPPGCDTHDTVGSYLTIQFKERPVIHLVTMQGTDFQVWVNEETQTWTITETYPGEPRHRVMCIVASGSGVVMDALSVLGERT